MFGGSFRSRFANLLSSIIPMVASLTVVSISTNTVLGGAGIHLDTSLRIEDMVL